MCGCNSTPKPATEYDVFDAQGRLVQTVQGETEARIAVTRLGGGKYVVKSR